jgi:hypothetical protein
VIDKHDHAAVQAHKCFHGPSSPWVL